MGKRRNTNKREASEQNQRKIQRPQQQNQVEMSPNVSLESVDSLILDPMIANQNRISESNQQINDGFILRSERNTGYQRLPTPAPLPPLSPSLMEDNEDNDDNDIDDEISALFPDFLFRNTRSTHGQQDDNAFCTEIVDQLKNGTNTLVQEIRESRTEIKQNMEESCKQIVHSINQFRSDLRKVLLQELPEKLNVSKK